MALFSVATITNVVREPGFRTMRAKGRITLTGDYAAGGADIVRPLAELRMPTTQNPHRVNMKGKGGYVYEYDNANQKVIIRQEGAAGSPAPEIPAAALPAGVTNDVIDIVVEWPKFG